MTELALAPSRPAASALRAARHFARFAVGGLFLAAGLLKVLIFPSFTGSTAAFTGVPHPLNVVVAALVVVAEIAIGVAFLRDRRTRAVAAVCAVLLVGFLTVLAHAEWTGLTAACHCFGTTGVNFSYRTQMGIDVVLLALVGFVGRTTPAAPAR